MCTVSYIPPRQEKGFILTSSRDEKSYRETLAPTCYISGDINLCYPKDLKAGGSWIAMNNQGRLCCLLNGGFIAHTKQSFHTRSRGKVLLSISTFVGKVEDYFETENLTDVEPFTIVTIDNLNGKISGFSEFVWDGSNKHFKNLNINQTYIWSSVTLYSEENRKQRRQWFSDFLKKNALNMTPEKVFSFHSAKHTEDKTNNVLMAREGDLKTVSITQVIQENKANRMLYTDLIANTQSEVSLWTQKNSVALQ